MSRQPWFRAAASSLLLLCLTAATLAQGREESFLERFARTGRFRLGQPSAAVFTPGGESVLFLRSGPRDPSQALYELAIESGEERLVLSATDLLEGPEGELSPEEKARRERQRTGARGLASFALSADGQRLLVPLSGRLFVVERATGQARELPSEAGPALAPRLSPDGARVACVRDGELYVHEIATGESRRLTQDASEHVTNGLAEFVAQEEMGRLHGLWWAPDGESLLFERADASEVERLYISDPARPEQAPQAWPYPRAGRANVDVRLGLVAATGGPVRWVEWDRERFPYVAVVKWSAEGPPTLVVQERSQQRAQVLAVDTRSGATQLLHEERDEAWLNIDQRVPHWLPNGEGFLWTTEREGDWALELRDPEGAFRRTIASASLGLRELLAVDAAGRRVFLSASTDSTQSQIVALSLDGGAPQALSAGQAEHAALFSKDGARFVLTSRFPDARVTHEVHDTAGVRRATLRSAAEPPSLRPTTELVRVRVEDREQVCAVLQPRGGPARGKLPVILYVYGGPHVRLATADGSRFLLLQWLADHGYFVVAIDGRGTPGRGRDWERAIQGDLVSVPLADQVAALQALAALRPRMDMSRVGVFGWSFGGTMAAMALAKRPDVFHAGVAVAPVVDWAHYDSHYTERYLGLPEDNPEGYRQSAVLTWAEDLSRPLLLLHGTADDNVYFLHSLALAKALFEAGRDFSFVPLVGQTHSVRDPEPTERLYATLLRHFARHLRRPSDGGAEDSGRY